MSQCVEIICDRLLLFFEPLDPFDELTQFLCGDGFSFVGIVHDIILYLRLACEPCSLSPGEVFAGRGHLATNSGP